VAPYKRIRAIEFVEAIPKSPSGKILRRVLRDRGTKEVAP
jgi:acyl-coenzyme A synthetase/AMP-(fatty) acid ligase